MACFRGKWIISNLLSHQHPGAGTAFVFQLGLHNAHPQRSCAFPSKHRSLEKKNAAEKKQRIFRREGCDAFKLPLYLLEGTASSGKRVPTQTGEGASSSTTAGLGCRQWVLRGLTGAQQHQEPNSLMETSPVSGQHRIAAALKANK